MKYVTILLLLIVGLIGNVFADNDIQKILSLDDYSLVESYLSSVVKGSSNEAQARKVAFYDHDLLAPKKIKELSNLLRNAVEKGALNASDFETQQNKDLQQ